MKRPSTSGRSTPMAPGTPSLGPKGEMKRPSASGRSTPMAPGTPSLGPGTPSMVPRHDPPGGPGQGGGSVTGVGWQLVEVDNRRASAESRRGTWSQGSSPAVSFLKSPLVGPSPTPPFGRSPLVGPRSPPTHFKTTPPTQQLKSSLLIPHHITSWSDDDLSNYSGRSVERRAALDRRSFLRSQKRSQDGPLRSVSAGAAGRPSADDGVGDGFDAEIFIGDWLDAMGHRVTVVRAESNRRRQDRLAFLATLEREGGPDKKFNIAKDRGRTEWTCGNGRLVRSESNMETVTWQTEDGRMSTWKRAPPEGSVYFDEMPPSEDWREDALAWQRANPHMPGPLEPPVYFDPPPSETQWTSQDGSSMYFWVAPDGSTIPYCNDSSAEWKAGETHSIESKRFEGLSAAATDFVPGTGIVATEAGDETAAGDAGQSPAKGFDPARAGGDDAAVELFVSKETPDVRVSGGRFEWTLNDAWGKLNRFPKDFCITSPMFGTSRATNMQLIFYPNGSRTAEAGHCTIALTRGPDSAGIKFEFLVNGTSSGPKMCLGSRFLGDYPKPFGDTGEGKAEKVVVVMQVLEVLGGPS